METINGSNVSTEDDQTSPFQGGAKVESSLAGRAGQLFSKGFRDRIAGRDILVQTWILLFWND